MSISIGWPNSYYNQAYSNPISPSGTSKSSGAGTLDSINNNDFSGPEVGSKKRAEGVECETCKSRKYQDGSNDPGVSFKTPAHIAPEVSAATVMSHEQEHVRNEKAKASAEGRELISQTVRLNTSVCPECGRSYVSGGLTTTVTKAGTDNGKKDFFMDNFKKSMANHYGKNIDVKI
ncbi:MAG: hypothetical protein N2645_14865 [Clostridia bacterium]|nr:hypothetical protein [Clostridia bacterium]